MPLALPALKTRCERHTTVTSLQHLTLNLGVLSCPDPLIQRHFYSYVLAQSQRHFPTPQSCYPLVQSCGAERVLVPGESCKARQSRWVERRRGSATDCTSKLPSVDLLSADLYSKVHKDYSVKPPPKQRPLGKHMKSKSSQESYCSLF